MSSALQKRTANTELILGVKIIAMTIAILWTAPSSFATTKGLSQIVTPDLQGEGDTEGEGETDGDGEGETVAVGVGGTGVAVGSIIATEIGLLTKEPFLLSAGFVNWSPHLNVDPQPFIEAGYYTEHHKVIVGAIHAGYKNEAILGYAYDFNERWRLQVDWQSGSENSSTIGFTCNVTRDFQFNPAIYFSNDDLSRVMGYIVFTYTFHLWGDKKR